MMLASSLYRALSLPNDNAQTGERTLPYLIQVNVVGLLPPLLSRPSFLHVPETTRTRTPHKYASRQRISMVDTESSVCTCSKGSEGVHNNL